MGSGMGNTDLEEFSIRAMHRDEIALAVDWAAVEGWNPGGADAPCFTSVDPGGFLVGVLNGEPVAVISAVNYDDSFSFLGFYIVRSELRGRGLGLHMWQAALAHAGSRTMGLDGVVPQQDNYRKSGFVLAHNNIRYGGVPADVNADGETVPLPEVAFDAIVADDARVFPVARPAFWKVWLSAPAHVGRALVRNGKLAGWGVIRPCRTGRKIGPLVADDREAAEAVFSALVGDAVGEVFLDVPQPNTAAVALAQSHGLKPVFETARMYSGPVRAIETDRIFGVTTFELG
jgi:GNAT superfamily N-acetyltransferase